MICSDCGREFSLRETYTLSRYGPICYICIKQERKDLYCNFCGEEFDSPIDRYFEDGHSQCRKCHNKEKIRIEKEGIHSRFEILDI